MAYSELVKNFEKVRAYMREFYVYGFKSRSEYDARSARSYDDERRRIESWLGEFMRFAQTPEGKSVFLSVDSRVNRRNPFYRAWKTRSFTDGDITLHFLLFDILHSPEVRCTLAQLIERIDGYLCESDDPMTFDESTIRKKLREYENEGLIISEKDGRRVLYRRAESLDLSKLTDMVDFFSEAAPCGVVGSFVADRQPEHESVFWFKHHYMTQAMDSQIMAQLFTAIREKRYITVDNLGKNAQSVRRVRLVPLKIYISAQNGRQNLIALHVKANRLNSYRLDYLSNVRMEEPCARFDDLRRALEKVEGHIWGVNCRWSLNRLEHVEFEIRVGKGEEHIVRRLYREKRCGQVERIDEEHYRFTAEVFDTTEMLPWIRTFLCRITRMNFSNRTAENRFKEDVREMYRMYGIGGDEDAVQ